MATAYESAAYFQIKHPACWIAELWTRWEAMNRYRLNVRPSSYYAEQFCARNIKIVPALEAYQIVDGEWKPLDSSRDAPAYNLPDVAEQGEVTIHGPMDFEVYLPAKDGVIDAELIELARVVLANIVEMDDAARSETSADTTDYEEYLSSVEIGDRDVSLHYVSAIMNTDWTICFNVHRNGLWKKLMG